MPVELFHWNPKRPLRPGRLARALPIRRRVNNFGDMIGPLIAERILHERGIDPSGGNGRLLTVGSVMHFAQPGDTVWGTGVNGKAIEAIIPSRLDVRAVRGPRSQAELMRRGIAAPAIFGDPGLLWSKYWPRSYYSTPSKLTGLTIVPNFHEWPKYRDDERAVNPRAATHRVIEQIANSRFVVGSSLHGIILAESFGIPARLITSQVEPSFKYDDYYFGTGRIQYRAASSLEEAIELGGESPPIWEPNALLDVFPFDLWHTN